MSGASHVAIAGAAENNGQERINPATGEPIGTADKPDTPAQPASEEQPKDDVGNPKKVPQNAHADGEEVETEGTFLGLNGHDWMVGGIGAAAGAAIVGGIWALCSGD